MSPAPVMRIFIVCPPDIGETYLRLERRGCQTVKNALA
jgi:hypothetical protein